MRNLLQLPIALALGLSTMHVLRADELATWPEKLPNTEALTAEGDLAAQMRAGIDRFVTRVTKESVAVRKRHWNRDFTSIAAYEKSIEPNRERFRKIIGLADQRVPCEEMQLVGTTNAPALLAENESYRVLAVRWPVLPGVEGEGLMLEPKEKPTAYVVALPDADQTPEMLAGLAEGIEPGNQFARTFAELGCLVIVPTLINRDCTWSGNPRIAMTNVTHREWIYRQSFEFGRHPIGFEIQKIQSAIDWFEREAKRRDADVADPKIAVAGFGEGGLLAFYAAAADTRIDAALVSGYFQSRQQLWDEPIYRNVWGLLDEFGDAEIATLVAPRTLFIESREVPAIEGPPAAANGRRAVAAPGVIRTTDDTNVQAEQDRIVDLLERNEELLNSYRVIPLDAKVGSLETVLTFCEELGLDFDRAPATQANNFVSQSLPDPDARQHRQVQQLVDYCQSLIVRSEAEREQFWSKVQTNTPDEWHSATREYKDYLWDEVIGRFPPATEPINPRTRKIYDEPGFAGYEVLLDVWPDVFCWGILLIPKDIPSGERRPVVVCQHGLEGQPADVITRDEKDPAYSAYKGFAARLAERGFVTYCPHNFYRGGNEFRQLQRKLNPLKKSMYSIILAQHERHLDWLESLPFVDAKRIGFYGLSYGGFTAIRVPPLLERYALSVHSAEFNDMVRKKVSVDHAYSYPFHLTYEVSEFNLAGTFGYGDLAALMVPRPYMVERGHTDGVGPDEWVAAEYAKVRRRYAFLGIPERTEIEFFNGPHTINGVATFKFLHRHLDWPEPVEP